MAASDVVTGKEGKISIDSNDIDVTLFTISRTSGVIDVTDSSAADSGYRLKLPAKFTDWNGTAEAFLKVGDPEISINSVLPFVGTAETTAGTVTYTGNIFVTEITDNIPVEAEEAAKVSFTFEGSGALTIVNSAV